MLTETSCVPTRDTCGKTRDLAAVELVEKVGLFVNGVIIRSHRSPSIFFVPIYRTLLKVFCLGLFWRLFTQPKHNSLHHHKKHTQNVTKKKEAKLRLISF